MGMKIAIDKMTMGEEDVTLEDIHAYTKGKKFC